ncbi:hypothetical protein GGI17_004515 [Coemansia sp. S146]|nr:hypothetical protein GGI17_004515 [Coemansia sp. S146]
MSTLSVFEILPPHVVRKIVGHVSGYSRLSYKGVKKGSDNYHRLQMPLLWVCQNFRAVVLSNFAHTCTMGIRQYARYIRPMWFSPPQAIDQPDNSTFHLAKELIIELDMWSVCTDEGLEYLLRVAFKDYAFPLVRSVKFLFDEFQEGEDLSAIPPNASANAAAFVKRILQTAPKASEIEMVTGVLSDDSYDDLQRHLSDLLAQLFQLATRVRHFSEGSDIIVNWQMGLVRNLVHLSYEVDVDGVNFVQLARQCAPTLQRLAMESTQNVDIIGLIRDNNGDYMEYPQLLMLEHSLWMDSEPLQLPVFSGASPFPRLKYLSFKTHYPFGDDTPFRGNTGTLETLSFTLDHPTLATLDRHRVFTPTSHPMLRYVDTCILDNDEPEHITTMTDLLSFALRIGPLAPMRKIDDLESDIPEWIGMLPLFGMFDSIQVLELPNTRLTLWDSITLVKSLPLLSDFHTSTPCLGEMPAGINLARLPAHVVINHTLIGTNSPQPPTFVATRGRRFRFWNIVEMRREELVEAVHCVLLMALLCPNFDYAAPPSDIHQIFMDKLVEIIHTDGYQQYSTRLQRLLFTS